MTKAKSTREAGAKPASAPATNASNPAPEETATSTAPAGDQDSGAPATSDAPAPSASDTAGEAAPPTPPADDQGNGSPESAETSEAVPAAAEIAGSEDDGEADPIGDLGGRVILVRSTSDRGRRRAGLAFGPIPTPVQVDELTDEQIAGLLADPQLIISLDD